MKQPSHDTARGNTSSGPHHRRLLITAPGNVELIEQQLPPLGKDDVYARTLISGISHGTEIAWFNGEAAALHRRWDPERRLFLNLTGREFPVAPGYETIGRVDKVGSAVTAVRVGDLIAIDAPHADGHILTERVAASGRLPARTDPERAVFYTLARVALGGIHDAALCLGDVVVVVGLGTVGLLASQMARLAGARVIGVDRYPLRIAAAEALGFEAILATGGVDIATTVRDLTGLAGADAAIEASGSYVGLHEAIRCLRVGGRVSTVASYHGQQLGLRLGEEYHRNRITLLSSMTVNGCPHRQHPAWDLERLNTVARQLVASGQVRTDGLITHRVPFAHANRAYALITETPHDTIKVVLTYEHE